MNYLGQLTQGELDKAVEAAHALIRIKRYLDPALVGKIDTLRVELVAEQDGRKTAEIKSRRDQAAAVARSRRDQNRSRAVS